MKKQRIVIAGAGISGTLIAAGLAGREDVDLVCLERVSEAGHSEAGTGLNIGPNAIRSLKLHLPASAEAIMGNSFPWSTWTTSLTDGRELTRLRLLDIADDEGIRIRWSELYTLLRNPVASCIRYHSQITGCGLTGAGASLDYKDVATGVQHRIENIDLLIGADGRYSVVRSHIFGGSDKPLFLGVCLYRILFPAGNDCPIDEYEQYFNGPNRLLAYKVPGDFIYCAGSFPIEADQEIPEDMKRADVLGRIYLPAHGKPSPKAAYLIAKLQEYFERIHWARLQEGRISYGDDTPHMLLIGDSAHPMVPTLGQGATQACEDACVVVDEIKLALRAGRSLGSIGTAVAARRLERIQFVVDFSREATDTMLAGADSTAGSLQKGEPAFLSRLETLYRDVPQPASQV